MQKYIPLLDGLGDAQIKHGERGVVSARAQQQVGVLRVRRCRCIQSPVHTRHDTSPSCVSCARVPCHTLAPSQVHRVELRLAELEEVPRMFGTPANESSLERVFVVCRVVLRCVV